jgi:hypothetical protein
VHGADQALVGDVVHADGFLDHAWRRLVRRRQRAERAGAGGQAVEPAEALVERPAQLVDARIVAQVERRERGFPAGGLDLVVERFERLLAARDGHHAPAPPRQLQRHGAADAARGAGDEGDAFFR